MYKQENALSRDDEGLEILQVLLKFCPGIMTLETTLGTGVRMEYDLLRSWSWKHTLNTINAHLFHMLPSLREIPINSYESRELARSRLHDEATTSHECREKMRKLGWTILLPKPPATILQSEKEKQ